MIPKDRKYMLSVFICLIFFLPLNAQEISIPPGYEIADELEGDLDKDNINEKVVLYNLRTKDSLDYDIERELAIYKKENGNWVIWKKSRNAVLSTGMGGMMGDPYESMEIKKGVLSVSFFGGSSWRWWYVDKYRFQNGEFELIGYTSGGGRPCYHWLEFDFNLSTGKIIFEKDIENCENEEEDTKTEREVFYKKGVKLNLNNRMTKDVKIVTPKYGHEQYL